MTPEQIAGLRESISHIREDRLSSTNDILAAHVVTECLDEIERLRGWLERISEEPQPFGAAMAAFEALDGQAVPS